MMYAGGAEHPLRLPCVRVLELVTDGRIEAATSAEVIQEILHRFSSLRRPDVGAAMAEETLDLFAPVLSVTHSAMHRTADLVRRYPSLAVRDLVHVATCQEYGIETIVSTDRGFDGVSEITRIDPEDADAIDALTG